MASGDDRPRWVNYANSYISQEDYKGTSRPGSLPPSSSSKSQPEESPGDGVKLYDTKWWLHQQPKGNHNPTSFYEPSWETLEMEENYEKLREFEEGEKKGEDEMSKVELLEALCHSQTRAREAEKAAQQANNEKQDMITHFMKQASQLFAYKQWLQILQLEANKNSKYQKRVGKRKKKKKKAGSSRYRKGESFGSFLLGLSLGGVGLLLGWTLGWLFR